MHEALKSLISGGFLATCICILKNVHGWCDSTNEGERERRVIAIDAEAATVREQGAQPGELRGHAIGLQSSNLQFSRVALAS
jgi:hypothetical protein